MVTPTVQKFLIAFVTIILGVVLLTVVATSSNAVSSVAYTANETATISKNAPGTMTVNTSVTYTLANSNTGSDAWKNDPTNIPECAITNFILRNQTGSVMTAGTGYTLNAAAGTFTLGNILALNSSLQNYTAYDYNYCPDAYVSTSFGRTSVQLIGGFFALALMAVGVGLFISIGKDLGIW